MARHTVHVAIAQWTDQDGVHHIAHRGDIVDLTDVVAQRFSALGVFDPDPDDTVDPAPEPVPDEPADSIAPTGDSGSAPADPPAPADVPERPKHAAPKESWVAYAAELYRISGGATGFIEGVAESHSRRDLIAALNDQTTEQEHHHG